MSQIRLSLIVPAKDVNDPKLKELLASIDRQDFPKHQMETLVITEGTSESAKAIGIRKAKGEVIGILASDNELVESYLLSQIYEWLNVHDAVYPAFYWYTREDNCLNRYFSLIGGNDPISYYMGKNDRSSYIGYPRPNEKGTIGDNGFFIYKELIEKTDLDNYYHIDNALEASKNTVAVGGYYIWHKTGGNIFKFFAKRYRYGLQHAFNKNRRWHLVDFRQPKDVVRLIWFIVCTLSIIQPIYVSFIGWRKIQDKAWFIHWIACLMTLITYSILMIHLALRKLSQSLSAPMVVRRA